jgi:hypothetical protein
MGCLLDYIVWWVRETFEAVDHTPDRCNRIHQPVFVSETLLQYLTAVDSFWCTLYRPRFLNFDCISKSETCDLSSIIDAMANLPPSLNWLEGFGEQALATPVLSSAQSNSTVNSSSFTTKARWAVSSALFSCTFETKSGPCTKVFPRSCDLKCVDQWAQFEMNLIIEICRKHQKNHTRPVACEIPGCKTRFPTLKDRDRHINSQHSWCRDGSIRYCCIVANCLSSIQRALGTEYFYYGFARKDAWQLHMTTHKLSRGQIREIRTKGIPTVVWKHGKWEIGHLDTVQRTAKRQEEAADAINKAPARITGDSEWKSEKSQC